MHENYRRRMMAARDPRFAKIAKRMGYGTRDMVAVLAEPVEQMAEPVVEPVKTPEPVAVEDEIVAVRAEYERVIGRRPFTGWDIDTLRHRIARMQDKG